MMYTCLTGDGVGRLTARTERSVGIWSRRFEGISPSFRCTLPRFANRRCWTLAAGSDPELSPADLMRQLAAEYGVKVAAPSHWEGAATGAGLRGEEDEAEEDEAEEVESWEDAVADLGNPWDMRPAKVGLMEEDEDDSPLPGAAAVSSGPSSDTPVGASTSVSPYLDPSALPRIGLRELWELAGLRPADGAGAVEGVAAAEGTGRGRLVLLDVAGEGEREEQAASGGAGPVPVAATAAPASSAISTAPVPYLRIPLPSLRRPQAEALAAQWDFVAVRALPGDLRAEQAVVRLTKVYGLRRVVLYDETLE